MIRGDRYYIVGPIPKTPDPSGTPEPWVDPDVIGQARPRIDGYERVSGAAVYPSDLKLPNMLHGAILRCPHAHARVLAVDTVEAAGMPGVRAVISAATPEAQIDWYYSRDSSTKLFEPVCRHEGEVVAAVAAETPEQAHDALRAIQVDYEVLPQVSDERRALEPDSAKVYPSGNQVGETVKYQRGDLDAGLNAADAVVSRSFGTPTQIHSALEPHGCVARWDGDRLTIWESTQGVFSVQGSVARSLGLPLSSVRVIGRYVGGGFGAKLQAGKYTMICALLSRQAARPVRLFLTREETFLAVGNRPPNQMEITAAARKDGTLTALDFKAIGTGGAYPAGGVSILDWLVRDLYTCPNVRSEMTDLFIHAGPARPFRAPGHPQGAWALEQIIDELAEALGMDPLDLRLKNIPQTSQGRGGVPYTSTGLARCLREGAEAFKWAEGASQPEQDTHIKRGVGLAAALWIAGAGGPPATIVLKLFADGSANLNFGASDIGTGTKTVMAMIVEQELGIPAARVQIEHADTGTTQFATPSGGSKTIPTEAPAVRDATLAVRRELLEIAAEELKLPLEDLSLDKGAIVSRSDSELRHPIPQLMGLRRRGVVVGIGYRGPNPEGQVTCPFAAQYCEVEVNTLTGETRVLRFLGAHDSGRVMNRLSFDNQVHGGIVMGLGLALTEERLLDHSQTGRMINANWHDYALPTAMDAPGESTSLPVEMDDPASNSTGAKGLGEPVTIPTAAAIANAIYNACGVRPEQAPVTPARLVTLLAEKSAKLHTNKKEG